jgi:hypothetical protein
MGNSQVAQSSMITGGPTAGLTVILDLRAKLVAVRSRPVRGLHLYKYALASSSEPRATARSCSVAARGVRLRTAASADRRPGGEASPRRLADAEGGWWFVNAEVFR